MTDHERGSPPPKTRLTHVRIDSGPEWVRVVPDGREGNTIFVRRLFDGEEDTGEAVSFVPGEETIILTQHIRYFGLHATGEQGRTDDLLTSIRAVPAGREGSTVYIRSLRPGEPDTGASVQVRPGDRVVVRAGDLILDLDRLEEYAASQTHDG